MKPLVKLMLVLATAFAMTFVIARLTGVLSVEQVEKWLTLAQQADSQYVMLLVFGLLFIDLFIAVPTLTIMILSGYFLGYQMAMVAAISGVMSAGIIGYLLSYRYGEKLERLIIRDEQQRQSLRAQFNQYGVVMILLSRAMPILPEVTACLSGISKMSFTKFLLAWTLSCVPYIAIATYAGSISTLQNPKPAILTAVTLSVFFWSCWFVFQRISKRQSA